MNSSIKNIKLKINHNLDMLDFYYQDVFSKGFEPNYNSGKTKDQMLNELQEDYEECINIINDINNNIDNIRSQVRDAYQFSRRDIRQSIGESLKSFNRKRHRRIMKH